MLRRSAMAAALCTVAPLAAGCGSSSSPLADGNAARLHTDVAGIRSAAAAHDPAAAHAAVRTLEADVGRFRTAGMLAPADAAVLLSDARQVNRQVSLEVQARTPAASPPAPAAGATPSGRPPKSPGAVGHGKGHGKHGPGPGGGGDGGD